MDLLFPLLQAIKSNKTRTSSRTNQIVYYNTLKLYHIMKFATTATVIAAALALFNPAEARLRGRHMEMADDLGAEFRANGDVVHPNTGVVFRGNGDVVHQRTGVVFLANGGVIHQRTGAVFSKDEDTDDLGFGDVFRDLPRGPFHKDEDMADELGGVASALMSPTAFKIADIGRRFGPFVGPAKSAMGLDEDDGLGNTYMSNGYRMNSNGRLANPSRSAQIRARDAGALTNREAARMGLQNKRDLDDELGDINPWRGTLPAMGPLYDEDEPWQQYLSKGGRMNSNGRLYKFHNNYFP